ncbi:S-adenosyl-L-methionine-dependent methyltransferase [Aspergillus aurantiobrunneus]
MEAIFKQIKDEYARADQNGKREIQGYIRELQVGFYSDWDVVMRLSSGPLQVALAKIAIDLDLFRILKESESPVALAELAEKTGAAPRLLARILRSQAAFGLIKETGPQEYTSSAFTDVFVNPDAAGAIAQLFDISGPCTQILPDYLAASGYKEIVSNKECPFQPAFRTEQTMFEWMPQHPKHMKSLGHLMALQRPVVWVDHFPVLEQLGDFPRPDKALMVDVGGGYGQQSKALRAKFPDLPGKVIVQDLPQTLAGAPPAEGVDFEVHNFFDPQPVHGAKFYYLRHVFHDWPDEQCVEILQHIIPALGSESRILIDEVVIPATGVPWQAAFMDLLMMDSLGGIERTRAEWEQLLDQAGLKIIESYQYDGKEQAILVANTLTTTMSTYTLLGATGATGASVLRHLLQTNRETDINVLVRSKARLLSAFPGLDQRRSPTVRIFEGDCTNPEALEACLRGAKVVFVCVGQNGSPMGASLVQDSAAAVVEALRRRPPPSSQPCSLIQLRSASLNPVLAAQVPRWAHRLVCFCLFAGYSDLRRACSSYEEASRANLLQYVLVDPPTLHDAQGTQPTGHRLIVDESQSVCLSYADLGVALCEIADRASEFHGRAVGVTATGPVKQTWGVLVGFLLQGGVDHLCYRYGRENLTVIGMCIALVVVCSVASRYT